MNYSLGCRKNKALRTSETTILPCILSKRDHFRIRAKVFGPAQFAANQIVLPLQISNDIFAKISGIANAEEFRDFRYFVRPVKTKLQYFLIIPGPVFHGNERESWRRIIHDSFRIRKVRQNDREVIRRGKDVGPMLSIGIPILQHDFIESRSCRFHRVAQHQNRSDQFVSPFRNNR